jgi:hypothetical protein
MRGIGLGEKQVVSGQWLVVRRGETRSWVER